jgi:hypothetical protein
MNWKRAKLVLWATGTCFSAAIAFSAAGHPIQEPPKGEIIMNNSCMGCHDFRNIETQALDEAGWTKLVNSMIEKGAPVKKKTCRFWSPT